MVRKSDDWNEIKIGLVGTHPLWGNYLCVLVDLVFVINRK
jgi:hypothetical protein